MATKDLLLTHLEIMLIQAHKAQEEALRNYRDACAAEDEATAMLREFNLMREQLANRGMGGPVEVSQDRPPERGRDR